MKYFVVYATGAKKHVVIPENWVFEHEIMIEKFVNYSINRNQNHLCFWSNETNENDEPYGEPNFNATRSHMFDGEICFYGKLVKYYSKYIWCDVSKVESYNEKYNFFI